MKKQRARCSLRPVVTKLLPAIAASLALSLATGCATNQPASPVPPPNVAIKRRLDQVLDAAMKKDFDRLESYHLYDSSFSKFESSGSGREGADHARRNERDSLSSIDVTQMRAEDIKIDRFGATAITTCILHLTFSASGSVQERSVRATLVFVKKDNEWRIVHEHLSPFTPAR